MGQGFRFELRPEFREVQRELANIAQLGSALWPDPERFERVTLESMSAVLLLDLSSGRLVEKLSSVLLARAQREGQLSAAEAAEDPFYRLQPEERLILTALHRGRWSYQRLASILSCTEESVQETAWAARLHLVYSPESAQRLAVKGSYSRLVPQGLLHPTGSRFGGIRCPEYHPGRPWTQRFLDNECSPREKLFFQEHLQACDPCRKALARARTFYYSVERLVPEPVSEKPEIREKLESLQNAIRQAARIKYPLDRTLGEALLLFVERRDVQLLMAAGALVVLWKIWR